MHAGLSYVEERNTPLSNPVWKTAGVNGLSPSGVQQVHRGAGEERYPAGTQGGEWGNPANEVRSATLQVHRGEGGRP